MPTLKYVGNAGRYRLTNSDVDVAQGEAVTVDDEIAAHLQEHGEFEVVETDEPAEGDESDGESAGEDFGTDSWLENGYQDRADAVHEGDVDDYLDEIEAAETSETVLDAVEERRDELED